MAKELMASQPLAELGFKEEQKEETNENRGRREEENKQPFSLTIIKTVAVFMSLFLLYLLALNLTSYTFTYDLSLMALIALFFGYLLADLITGTVHWFCDNFFSEKTRWKFFKKSFYFYHYSSIIN